MRVGLPSTVSPLLLAATCTIRCPCPTTLSLPDNLKFREGTLFDAPPIAAKLLSMKMNPLGVDPSRFLVAESDGARIGFGQIRPLGDTSDGSKPLWELASIYVEDDFRGKGIGSALVQRLLERHTSQGRALTDTFLLTLEPTVNWYEQFGFERLPTSRVPKPMELEVKAGEALSAVLGNKLVAMQGAESPQ